MASKRKILETFSRQVLLDIAKNFEITGLTGKSKAEIIGALVGVRSVSAEAVLGLSSRENLKTICRDLGLDDKGREKQGLIDRLLGRSEPPPPPERTVTAVMKKPAAEDDALGNVEDYQNTGAKRKNNPPAKIAAKNMSDSQPLCDIRTAFPLIPEDSLIGLLAGLSPHEPIGSLIRSADATPAFESLADWMLRSPSTCVGTTLPGLWLARDEVIQATPLPVRIGTALARLSITVWGEVLELTPSLLLDIRGFGEGSLRSFLAAAARTSAEACCRQTPPAKPPTIDVFEPRRFPPRSGFRTSQFRRLVDWAVNEAHAMTVSDLLAACSQPHLPEDIVLLCDALRTARLSDVFPGISRGEWLESQVDDLCGVLDKRSQTIFLGRISLNHLRTLDDLGTEIGVTRERVRQLWVLAEERIREALATPRFTPIGWRAHTLRTMLGTAVPGNTHHLNQATQHVARGVSEEGQERVLDFLLWLAGPYSLNSATGWLQAGEVPSPEIIDTFSDERGRMDMERLQQHLSGSGLLPGVQAVWLDQIGRIRKVEGNWLLWAGTVSDKAARLLEIWGQPATPEEIVNAIGEGHDVRGTRSRLFEDERFMRVDMTRVGLRSWGLEEYSSIAEEIDQELDRRGGTAAIGDLIATLVTRFNLREASIRFYINAPMFVLEGDTIRRRTSADAHDPVPPVTDTAGCYLLGADALSWRVEVTTDMLRGSGRQMPAPIAAWLGVMPGCRRSLTADGGAVGVTWPETSANGPALGSIRFLVERVEGRAGDQVLLAFRRDEGTVGVTRIDPTAANAAQGLQRLSLLTGIPQSDGEGVFLHALGQALGTRGTLAAISAALRGRGESALAALVPAESESPELDAAIDALKDLF